MRLTTKHGLRLGLLALTLALLGCVEGEQDLVLAERDRATFDATVWPILVRDCGFSECHGSAHRFFRVVGPGHARLDPATRMTEPVTAAELQLSYDRARSMIDARHPERSLLLTKPLDVSAGGAGHEGVDRFGLDVYRSVADPSYQVLRSWVLGTLQ
jgi:hypothetical protein